MKLITIILLSTLLSLTSTAQINDSSKVFYNTALNELKQMLEEKQELSFKKAVFISENTYFENTLSYQSFCNSIEQLHRLCLAFIKTNSGVFLYDDEDKENVLKHATIFKVMADSIPIQLDTGVIVYHPPFTYDFEDIWGQKNWSKMFVSKLLYSHTGNCHSLPYLYKILAEELGTEAYLSLAPNHIYIKHYAKKTGMYNTELTSATFPVDAWLMASGYIHTDAIRSGIYMDTLSLKQSIALCVIDLATGYDRKYGKGDGTFILSCCDLALQYYPNYINALLLKAETMKKQFDLIMEKYKAQYPSDIFYIKEAKQLFDNYETLIKKIHESGYRRMPESMYIKWLDLLKIEREKYINKKIINNFTNTNKN